jgi:2'-5' RNA ligase
LRCFVALEIPAETRQVLLDCGLAIQALEPSWVGQRWVSAEVMHVTLKFLGELDSASIERFATDFTSRARAVTPFVLDVAQLRAVPRLTRATMLWASMEDPTGRCCELALAAQSSSLEVGVRRETRPFVPHVTLVRTRTPRAVSSATLVAAGTASGIAGVGCLSVLSATLYSSTLTPAGPVHERMTQFRLGPS